VRFRWSQGCLCGFDRHDGHDDAVDDVSGSELHLAWAQDATSAEIARFAGCATRDRVAC
jgi:hypothetical protein